MAATYGRLVAIDVKPGSSSDSQSGLNLLKPTIYGRLAAEGCGKELAFVVIHPSSNFFGHYLLGPLERRGRAILALNTRFAGNDVTLTMERCIQDLGAGIAFLRTEGYRRIVLLGNSGGGSLAAFYQSQAERLSVTDTPDGRPIELSKEDLPPIDGLAMCAAHPGRAQVLTDWLDPSVTDETDMLAADPALDMYDAKNGPPYEKEWLERYRAAQRARNERITDWALARIRAFDANTDPDGPKDAPFLVYRTAADPRFVDLTLDPSDRKADTTRGSARASNYGTLHTGRICSLRSWLSQWSVRLSRADGPACLAKTRVPVLSVLYSADSVVFPSQVAQWAQAAKGRCKEYTLKGATHHMVGQPKLVDELADLLVGWAGEL
ncbi:MAG TPA: alpha/beta hydrolase [Burkholderiales bacterium]